MAATVGRFVVVKELGRGAMGLVLQAWDPRLSRHVAIKLPDLSNAGPQGLARFEREASAAGRLRHPGIVSVLEVGDDQGRPFLVMDLIEGESFEALLRRERLPARRAVEIVLEVARAVAHAHAQGVVHRDIKPANVLLDRDGHAHLTDFGIARSGSQSDLTSTGTLMGTPECMAPEQAGDSGKKHGPASDVYALGATLYRALVGKPPITGENLQAFFKKLFEELPQPPRTIDRTIDPALDAVIMKCLQKEPAARFADAGVLARALDAWMTMPVAPPPTPRGLGAPQLIGALILAAGAAAGVVGVIMHLSASVAPTTTETASSDPSPELDPRPDPEPAPPPDPAASLPRPARLLARSPRGTLQLTRVLGEYVGKHPDEVAALALSDDSRLVLSGTGFWTHAHPGMMQLRVLATGEELQAWRAHESSVTGVAFSRDATRAISCGWDGAVHLWDLASPRKPLHTVRTPGKCHGLARLVGGAERVAVVDDSGAITSFEVGARTLEPGPGLQLVGPITAISALPDGRVFVACNEAPECLVDLATGEVQPLPGDTTAVNHTAVSPDGRFAAATTHTDEVWCWDLVTPRHVAAVSTRPGRARGVTWHGDSKRVVLGNFEGEIVLWSPLGSSALVTRGKLAGAAWSFRTIADGRVLVGPSDCAWRLFDVDEQRDLTPLPPTAVFTIRSMAVSADDRRVIVGCGEGHDRGSAHVFDLSTGERVASFRTGLEHIVGVGLDAQGTRALLCGTNGSGTNEGGMRNVQIVDVATRKVVLDFAAVYSWRLSSAAQSPDGRLVVTTGEDGRAHAWDLEAGAMIAELGPPAGWVTGVAFCPQDPRRVVTLAGGVEGKIGPTLRGWDLNMVVETKVDLPATPRAVACFSTSSQVLVGFDGPVERWSLLTGECVTRYPSHRSQVLSVAISPDGRRVLSCGHDGFVRLSDTASGQELDSLDLGLSGDWPTQVAFVTDERLLIATARAVVLDVTIAR